MISRFFISEKYAPAEIFLSMDLFWMSSSLFQSIQNTHSDFSGSAFIGVP